MDELISSDESAIGFPYLAGLQSLPTDALFAELRQALEVTAAHLVRLAAIWRELEARGQDLSGLRGGLWSYMTRIASGKLKAEVVVAFAGHATLLRRLAELPHTDQDRILADKMVAVAVEDKGQLVVRWMPVTHLGVKQLNQVFAEGRIVPAGEQEIAKLPSHRLGRSAPGVTPQPGLVAPATVVAAQASPSITLAVSKREMVALLRRAKAAGTSVELLMRAALIEVGLLY